MALIPGFFGSGGGGGRGSSIFDPFSLDIWDPLANFPFTGAVTSSRGTTGGDQVSNLANVRVDWKETPEAHIIQADLPGLKKEEVKVEVEENRVLQIRGEMSREKEETNDTWHRMERSVGKFVRRFRLPENAKVEEIKASMENGVLSVVVPKAEQRQAEVKAIDIAGE